MLLQAYPQAGYSDPGCSFMSPPPFLLFCQIIQSKIRTRAPHAGLWCLLSAAIPGVGLCSGCLSWLEVEAHPAEDTYDRWAAPGTITSHSWMGFCFQTSLLQPATHILQAILMFLESPPNNNHIIQISRTCGPLNSCQNQIHVPLRGARGIAETKRRHVKLRE